MNKLYIKSMSNFNRKYPKVKGWWCYCLITPNGMFYIGQSKKQCSSRWYPRGYKNKAIYPYIEKYGWDNIRKVVLCDGLTEDQAIKLEGLLIEEARKGGWCINKLSSGGKWRDNPKEYGNAWSRNRDTKNDRKIYKRVCNYNCTHTPIETPLEAKQKYLEYGYIPSYIKNDDLL